MQVVLCGSLWYVVYPCGLNPKGYPKGYSKGYSTVTSRSLSSVLVWYLYVVPTDYVITNPRGYWAVP